MDPITKKQEPNVVRKESLSTKEASELIGLSSQTVINWCNQERFKVERIGKGGRKIDSKAFRGYLIEQKREVVGFTDRPLEFEAATFRTFTSSPSDKKVTDKSLSNKDKKDNLMKIVGVLKDKESKLNTSQMYDKIASIVVG